MRTICPRCNPIESSVPNSVVGFGSYYRKSDYKHISRFKCLICEKTFSAATTHPCFNQKKRQFNETIRKLFCSGVSLRRLSLLLNMSRTTISRKLIFLGESSIHSLHAENLSKDLVQELEFDDLETFEHTKCKPLSVTLAVESKTRRILGFRVSVMPAKGPLASISRKKYGKRRDERHVNRRNLFAEIKPLVSETCLIKSDENPYYLNDVRKYFPHSKYERFKGQRGRSSGLGELKKIWFDPLFSLNHTCAMLRANINRLFRKTWCTTKKKERLESHIAIYTYFHNQVLIKK